ncbi:hypothetical protein N7540_010142 [Penicillium herquei]|nr:hypothetical protein N7540_010142 [Penicillium herquei]
MGPATSLPGTTNNNRVRTLLPPSGTNQDPTRDDLSRDPHTWRNDQLLSEWLSIPSLHMRCHTSESTLEPPNPG